MKVTWRLTTFLASVIALTAWAPADSPVTNWRTGGHYQDVADVEYSADGSRLLTGDGQSTRLWRPSDRVLLWSDRAYGAQYYSPVSVSPANDCFFVTVGQNGADKIERRNLSNGSLLETISTTIVETTDLVAASATRFYATTNTGTYEFRKSGSTWSNTWTWSYGNNAGYNAVLDPTGRWLVVTNSSETIRVFDTVNRQASPTATIDFSGTLARLAFSPNGAYLAVACGTGGLYFVSAATWSVTGSLPFSNVLAVDWYPGNVYIGVVHKTGTNEVSYKKFNKNGAFAFASPTLLINDNCYGLSISPSTSQAAFGAGPDVRLWRSNNTDQGFLPGHRERVTLLDYSYDDSRCFSAADREVRSWDTTTGTLRLAFHMPQTVRGIGSGGGNLAVATSSGVTLYNQLSGALVTQIPVGVNTDADETNSAIDVSKASFGGHGSAIVVPSTYSAILYKANTGAGIQGINVGSYVRRARFSGDAVRLFVGTQDKVYVYRATNLVAPEQIVIADPWRQLMVNANGSRFFTVPSGGNIQEHVRNGTTWTRGRTLVVGNGSSSYYAALSSDGSLIAIKFHDYAGLGGKIEVRRVSDWSLVETFDSGIGQLPYAITYSRFDQYLAFSDYWNLGAMAQTWNSQRSADAWTVDLTPAAVTGGGSVTGRVRLTRAAPAGGLTVTLSSGNPSVAQPAVNTLQFAEGETQKSFMIQTSTVAQSTAVSINARFRRQASGRLVVTP